MGNPTPETSESLKACCAALYESDWARLLLGESFHPGGLGLTERLGALAGLGPGARVLDVAAGSGASAVFLARRFGCEVVGLEYGSRSVATARSGAAETEVADRVVFQQGDAERLPFADGAFDALICECAFCTFPDKAAAAGEFGRVLRPGGRLGLSDVTRTGPLPAGPDDLAAWIACIGDARSLAEYRGYLEAAGLVVERVEPHDEALAQMVRDIRGKLLAAELAAKLKKLELPAADLERAKALARCAGEAVRQGRLGYALLVATKPESARERPA
ncbi:MAG: class I SAM-dependent methyltransferase [Gemmatimonadota bacterium]